MSDKQWDMAYVAQQDAGLDIENLDVDGLLADATRLLVTASRLKGARNPYAFAKNAIDALRKLEA